MLWSGVFGCSGQQPGSCNIIKENAVVVFTCESSGCIVRSARDGPHCFLATICVWAPGLCQLYGACVCVCVRVRARVCVRVHVRAHVCVCVCVFSLW